MSTYRFWVKGRAVLAKGWYWSLCHYHPQKWWAFIQEGVVSTWPLPPSCLPVHPSIKFCQCCHLCCTSAAFIAAREQPLTWGEFLYFLGLHYLMATVGGFSPPDFWSADMTFHQKKNMCPFNFNQYMPSNTSWQSTKRSALQRRAY